MNIQHVAASADERGLRQLIDTAGQLLNGTPVPEGFVARLFLRASVEDIAAYTPSELAALATQAYAFMAERMPGVPKIGISDPQDLPDAGKTIKARTISVIELLNDDMPFLVDSVMAELAARNIAVRLVVHPILAVARDRNGRLEHIAAEDTATDTVVRESYMQVHVDRIDDEAVRASLIAGFEKVLADVMAAVYDWRPMLGRVGEVIADMKANPPPLPAGEVSEAVDFLEWLVAENFTFLGLREYRLSGPNREPDMVPDSALGVLRRLTRNELKGRAGEDVILHGL